MPNDCSPVAFRLSSVCEYKAPKEEQNSKKSDKVTQSLDEIFEDEYLENSIETATKALDASVDIMNATTEALKVLDGMSK